DRLTAGYLDLLGHRAKLRPGLRDGLATHKGRIHLHGQRRPVLRIPVDLALVLEAVEQSPVERLRLELGFLRVGVERLEDALTDPVREVFSRDVEEVWWLPRRELGEHRGMDVLERVVVDLDVRMRSLERRDDLLHE